MTLKKTFPAVAALVSLGIGLAAPQAVAQNYPEKPIRILVGAAAGGPSDLPARFALQILQAKFGQPVIIENRPGAAGTVAGRFVASAPPDGYTLLVGNTTILAVQPSVSASAGFEPKNFAAVAMVSESFLIPVVSPSSPFKTLKELVDYAKANPGKLNYGHTGPGGSTNLAGELFKLRAGINIVGVPFRSGAESVTGVMSGAIELTFENPSILLPLIRDGKLRALAVTSGTRIPLAPELPTTEEAGVPNFVVTGFNGIVAPAGTPDAIVKKLNAALNEGLSTPEMRATIEKLGVVPRIGTPEDFSKYIDAQYRTWQQVAKAANIKID